MPDRLENPARLAGVRKPGAAAEGPTKSAALSHPPRLGTDPSTNIAGLGKAGQADTHLYGLCHLTHAIPCLAAFSAGAVLTAVSPEAKAAFEPLGEARAEPAKSAALLVFGALPAPQLFGDLPFGGYVAVILAIGDRRSCFSSWPVPRRRPGRHPGRQQGGGSLPQSGGRARPHVTRCSGAGGEVRRKR